MDGVTCGLGGKAASPAWFVCVELAESVFSFGDAGNFTPYKLRIVVHNGATKRPARLFRVFLDPPDAWINAARRQSEVDLCAGRGVNSGRQPKDHPPPPHAARQHKRFRKTCNREQL